MKFTTPHPRLIAATSHIFSFLAMLTTPLGANVLVQTHGAKGDGKTLDTAAIQAAIDESAQAGGGTVSFSPGIYISGTLELKSHVVLEISPGATLKGSADLNDYRDNGFKHNEMHETTSLLFAIDQTDIRITGGGTIDLTDQPFLEWDSPRPALPAEEAAKLTPEQLKECVVKPKKRPTQPIFFQNVQGLRLDNLTVKNSPCWTISINSSRDIFVHHLLIDNNPVVPNNDGMHFCSSKDIVISDCIIRAGDDCIAFTGITNWPGICERISVTNCSLQSKSAALHLGHLASKVRNVVFNNLVITDSNRGIAIQAGDDGWVENVEISNIVMETRIVPGEWWGKGEPILIATSGGGRISGVSLSHIRAVSDNSITIVGTKQSISGITLSDWDIALRYGSNRPLYGRFIDLQPAPTRPAFDAEKHIPWLYADSIKGLNVHNVHYRSADGSDRDMSAYVSDVTWSNGSETTFKAD